VASRPPVRLVTGERRWDAPPEAPVAQRPQAPLAACCFPPRRSARSPSAALGPLWGEPVRPRVL
jgi:hypothetical protein